MHNLIDNSANRNVTFCNFNQHINALHVDREFRPQMSAAKANALYSRWTKAVEAVRMFPADE